MARLQILVTLVNVFLSRQIGFPTCQGNIDTRGLLIGSFGSCWFRLVIVRSICGKVKTVARPAIVTYRTWSGTDIERDDIHIGQFTMCQRKKSVMPLLPFPENQHEQGGSYEVLVMPHT